MIQKLKFKKLLNEYKSYKFELEMIREILKDGHLEFEVFYRRWCAENDVDLEELNKANSKSVEIIFEKQKEGLVLIEKPTQESTDKHKKVFREIARKIHPDKLETSHPRITEYTNSFKDANRAIEKQNWGVLFEIVEKYDIWLTDYDEACEDIQKSINQTKELIESEKRTYSWFLYKCDNDEDCKEKVVKNFLYHLFGWKR